MSLQIKIQGGTPKTGKGLCHSCKYSLMAKGQDGQDRIVCNGGLFATGNLMAGPVTFRVHDCSLYHPSNMPWIHEMEQMAWIVEARRRGPKGFEQPEESEMEVIVRKPNSSPDSPQQVVRNVQLSRLKCL